MDRHNEWAVQVAYKNATRVIELSRSCRCCQVTINYAVELSFDKLDSRRTKVEYFGDSMYVFFYVVL